MSSDGRSTSGFECPAPIVTTDSVLLGHGSGGKLSARLLEETILPALTNPMLAALDDRGICAGRLAARRLHDRFVRRHASLLPRRGHR